MTAPRDTNQVLTAAYQHCGQLSRRSASSFYYSFWLLPSAKRRAMCALYAFLRQSDDLADNDQPASRRREQLQRWRAALHAALCGQSTADPVLVALADTVQRYAIPTRYFDETLDGVEQDLEPAGFADFGQLELYCYRVASTVGLLCIHVWGFRDPQALDFARQCGIAFQLTNILRDLPADARAGRCYIPRDELARFGCSAAEIASGSWNDGWQKLIRFQVERAEAYYAAAAALPVHLHRDGRGVYAAMFRTYASLLAKIKHGDGNLFRRRIRLSRWRQAAIAARSLVSTRLPAAASSPSA